MGLNGGIVAMDPVPDVDGECDVNIGFRTAVVGHAVLLARHTCAHMANNVPCRDTTCNIHVKGTVFCCFDPFFRNIASSSDSLTILFSNGEDSILNKIKIHQSMFYPLLHVENCHGIFRQLFL